MNGIEMSGEHENQPLGRKEQVPEPSIEKIDASFSADAGIDPVKRDAWLKKAVEEASDEREASYVLEARQKAEALRAERDEIIKKLKDESSDYFDADKIDALVGRAIKNNQDGYLTPLLLEGIRAWRKQEPYNFLYWSHSVCHQFEKCRSWENTHSSIQDFPELLEDAEALVNHAVELSLKKQEKGCMDRIVGGIIAYNIRNASPETLDHPFAWLPESLRREEFVQYLSDYQRLFVQAKTPLEYIEKLAALVASGAEDVYAETIPLSLLVAARNDRNATDIDGYIAENAKYLGCQKIEPAQAVANFKTAEQSSEVAPGLFVDVEGSLLAKDYDSQQDELTELAEALDHLSPAGAAVTIFSGGDPEELTKTLNKLGFPQRFLPVRSKQEFVGKKLETLIDDSFPAPQGFGAVNYFNPHAYGAIKYFVTLDPFGVVEDYKRRTSAK